MGHSAIFGPEGRRLDFVDHWEQGAVTAEVPLRTGITPAVAGGIWIAVGISAVGILGWLGALGSERRAVPRRSDSHRPGSRRRDTHRTAERSRSSRR